MDNAYLDKYQLAWKNDRAFQAATLSEVEITGFMKSASKIMGQYKRSLLFDIILKGILSVSFLVLLFLQKSEPTAVLSNATFMVLAVFGMIWQLNVYQKARAINVAKDQLSDLLRASVDFYNRHYFKSILVSALSSSLFFIGGSLFYLYFKHGQIPAFQTDDFIVFGLGVILSYAFSSFIQIKQTNFQAKELETCLIEIEAQTIDTWQLKKYKTNQLKNRVVMIIALVVGLVFVLYLIFLNKES